VAQDPEADGIAAHADQARASFNRRFWHAAGGYLNDVVDGENGEDDAFRPNQTSRWRSPIRSSTRSIGRRHRFRGGLMPVRAT